ncbi:hypothetical protein HY522_05760 [bacterium]|nr:hypothetical protein [bacterium]
MRLDRCCFVGLKIDPEEVFGESGKEQSSKEQSSKEQSGNGQWSKNAEHKGVL